MKSFFYKFHVDTIAKFLIILIIILLGTKELYQSYKFSNNFSTIVGKSSERNAVFGGQGFADKGFLSNSGLPDIKYGGKILHNRDKKDSGIKHKVKLTYPPGPHWLVGLYIKICGWGNVGCYRIFPTILGIISLIVIARTLLSVLGPIKSALMMLSLAVVPVTTNIMHGLYYLTYSSTLFLVQLALLLKIFKGNPKENKKYLFILFIAGFIQGWFSWDYIFLVCLSAVPFALLYFQDTKEYRNRFLLAILACSIGFLFAHFLHLIQVVIYKGSILAAYEALYLKTMNRFDGSFTPEAFQFHESRLRITLKYLFVYAGQRGNFFIIHFPAFLVMLIIPLLIQEANLTIQRPLQIALNWKSSSRNIFVILTAFIVSLLWIFIMKQHAYYHPSFFSRHLFLLYFICLLTVLECVSFKNENTILQKK